MCQTRAMSRAARSAFAHVVVLIDSGLSTTPAEEVPCGGFDDEEVSCFAGQKNLTVAGAGKGTSAEGNTPNSSTARGNSDARVSSPARPKPAPVPSKTSSPAALTDEQAWNTAIHFGKNQGKRLIDLTDNQKEYYLPKGPKQTTPRSDDDRRLLAAIRHLAPLPADTAATTGGDFRETRIPFGKNRGLMLSELSPQQVHWYETDWMPKKVVNGPASAEDWALIAALKAYRAWRSDHHAGSGHKRSAAQPENENQETAALLTNLGQLISQQQGFSGDDLRDWLRTSQRGSKPILAADKEIEDLPASELESILKNWKKVIPVVTAFRKKRENQELLDTMPLN